MSIKIITGVPGSGKSFYAVKEVITKHFEWSDKINEWVNLTDVTIISNIVGLKLPHIRFDPYLKENNIDYKKFFTSNYFKKILIPKYKKVVILLDEAQKLFPYSFRDIKGAENDP
ncbi:MAG: zonular occludens toxin domain-containing protein, partial [Methylococcaceae bacterium]|nr:zonular occludens toxin domain-containing protein [Methylococcaceae bacterium]